MTSSQWLFTAMYAYLAIGLCYWLRCYLNAPENRVPNIQLRLLVIMLSLVSWPIALCYGVNAEVCSEEEDEDEA